MNTNQPPEQVAYAMAHNVLTDWKHHYCIGAALVDNYGIFGWGWNYDDWHAERHAVRECNRKRLVGAIIYVVGFRRSDGGIITARPCERMCLPLCRKWRLRKVIYSISNGLVEMTNLFAASPREVYLRPLTLKPVGHTIR